MPLWLGELIDVEQRRLVLTPHALDPVYVRLDESRVVPTGNHVDVDPRPVVRSEAAQHVRDGGLRGFGGDRHRDAITVVPDR